MESHSPSEQVIRAVAEREGAEPIDLPPLFDAVDPDALDRMAEADVTISFEYVSYTVSVHGGKQRSVTVQPATETGRSRGNTAGTLD